MEFVPRIPAAEEGKSKLAEECIRAVCVGCECLPLAVAMATGNTKQVRSFEADGDFSFSIPVPSLQRQKEKHPRTVVFGRFGSTTLFGTRGNTPTQK